VNLSLRLRLLRHGNASTGGAIYESILFAAIVNGLKKRGLAPIAEKLELPGFFRGLRNLSLLKWGFRKATADVNIVVARLALPALLRNLNGGRKNLIVLHYFDERDGKGRLLAWYYKLFFAALRKADPNTMAIICVSPFFEKYFQARFPKLEVILFPNLFNTEQYLPFRNAVKASRKIFLGQYSFKNDASIFRLAALLTAEGYKVFFCTLYDHEAGIHADYEVKKFGSFQEYLGEMATSFCTIAFTGINEGWNRLVHESILVRTPVLGYAKGGLGDLLRESRSYIVEDEQEAFDLIRSGNIPLRTPEEFYSRYDLSHAEEFVKPVLDFIRPA
jgi:hypothetical protein